MDSKETQEDEGAAKAARAAFKEVIELSERYFLGISSSGDQNMYI